MPRFYHPGWLFEVARRTQRGEDLFDAGDAGQVSAIVGIFAEAQRRHAVEIFHLHFMSNHYHGLFRAPSATRMARFLNFVHGEIAKLVNRSRACPGAVWSGKFAPLPVTTDARTLLTRMAYITAQAVRARLVEHPSQFSGVSALGWLLSGVPLMGRYGREREAPPPANPARSAGSREAGTSGDPRCLRVEIAKLPGFEDRGWPELHALFAAMADELAGRTVQGAGLDGMPGDVTAGRGMARNPGAVAAVTAGRAGAAAPRGSGEPRSGAHRAHKAEGASSQSHEERAVLGQVSAPPVGPGPAVAAQLPGEGAATAPAIRGPVRPKGDRARRGQARLRVLSCSVEARCACLEVQARFCAAYAAAMARLRRRLRRGPSGVRWPGGVVFPPHALLPGGLAPP